MKILLTESEYKISPKYDRDSDTLTIFMTRDVPLFNKKEKKEVEFENVVLTSLGKKIIVFLHTRYWDKESFIATVEKYGITVKEFEDAVLGYASANPNLLDELDDVFYNWYGQDLTEYLIGKCLDLSDYADGSAWEDESSDYVKVRGDYYENHVDYPDVDDVLSLLRKSDDWALINSLDRDEVEHAIQGRIDSDIEFMWEEFWGTDDIDYIQENLKVLKPKQEQQRGRNNNYYNSFYGEFVLNVDYNDVQKDLQAIIDTQEPSVQISVDLEEDVIPLFEQAIKQKYGALINEDLDWIKQYYSNRVTIDAEQIADAVTGCDDFDDCHKRERKGR